MYCKECGKQISEDSKFCSQCGSPVNIVLGVDGSGKRRTFYKGVVQRCPFCNEIVNDSDIICPSCKQELRGFSSSATIQNLANQLRDIDSETRNNGGTIIDVAQRQENCIRNYAIPYSKSDLSAMMWYTSSKIEFDILEHGVASDINMGEIEFQSKKILSEAWYDKEEEIYELCKRYLHDDGSLQDIEKKHSEISYKYSIAQDKARASWERYNKNRKKEIKKKNKLDKRQIELNKIKEKKELEIVKIEREQQASLRKRQEFERKRQNSPARVTNNYYYTETAVSTPVTPTISNKSKGTALFLCIFLGFIGAHQFYAGRSGKGLLYLFTLGLIGIGWIIDIFSILAGSLQDGNGLYIKKW